MLTVAVLGAVASVVSAGERFGASRDILSESGTGGYGYYGSGPESSDIAEDGSSSGATIGIVVGTVVAAIALLGAAAAGVTYYKKHQAAAAVAASAPSATSLGL